MNGNDSDKFTKALREIVRLQKDHPAPSGFPFLLTAGNLVSLAQTNNLIADDPINGTFTIHSADGSRSEDLPLNLTEEEAQAFIDRMTADGIDRIESKTYANFREARESDWDATLAALRRKRRP